MTTLHMIELDAIERCPGRVRPRLPILTPFYVLALAWSWRSELRG